MSKPTERHGSPAPAGRGYETSDVRVGFMARVVFGLAVLTLLGMGVSLWFQSAETKRFEATDQPPSPLAATLPAQPPEPRLQVQPAVDLNKVRAQEEAALNSYAWIDAQSGLVRIPIDRAIELVAQRGLPARPQPAETGPGDAARRK
ncbi:MAG: hypothetical protein ACRD4D_01085 [Candidatus Acidiferrales bacterium]